MPNKMRFVIDTNILIDALVEREPHARSAHLLLALGYIHEFELWIGTSQITDFVYVITDGGKKSLSQYAKTTMQSLRQILQIYATNAEDYDCVSYSAFDNLEDAFVYQTALHVKAHGIISRDCKGFKHSSIPVYDCESLFEFISKTKGINYDEVVV